MDCNSVSKIHHQSGTALLGFMLIIVVSLSYYLIRNLNQNFRLNSLNAQTTNALAEAKQALLSWAVSHPVNPGALPMPDRNGDGEYSGESDCFNGAIGNNLLLGKMPWRDVASPCKDASELSGLGLYPVEHTGEVLWYAVSKNLVYESPSYPIMSIALLNKTMDWITVRDPNGVVISDRVAFVVLAPGAALGNQNRSGTAPSANQYLDSVTIDGTVYSNADTDQDFIIYPNSNLTADPVDNFNDRLVFVTIDKLMDGIKKRVLNEIGNFLSGYRNDDPDNDDIRGIDPDCPITDPTCDDIKLPWLSPFSDPKSMIPVISGVADNSSNGVTLVDSGVNFTNTGVKSGDILRNISDGSIGLINSVGISNPNTLTVSNLVLGSDNDFDRGDRYYITPLSYTYLTSYLSGTTTGGSSGLTLEDINADFIQIGVQSGDIVENISDGSSGVISDISTNEIIVKSLAGGAENDFDNAENYQIRTNMGVATDGSSGNVLEDTSKDFLTMGVMAGDYIWNITDDSFGKVNSVTTTTISVDSLQHGTDNNFDVYDVYILPRFNTVSGTSAGQLAFHAIGEWFFTSFNVDWNISVNSGDVAFDSANFPGVDDTYITSLENQLSTYAAAGNTTFPATDSACAWSTPEMAECRGSSVQNMNISGTVTSGNNTSVLTDSNAKFIIDGVKGGDIVQNYDDEFNLSPPLSGIADANSSDNTLFDAATNFETRGVTAYQYLIHNNSTGVRGFITEIVDNNTIKAIEFDNQSSVMTFSPGDSFTVYSPGIAVVTNVISNTAINTARVSEYNPGFDGAVDEYYRILTASHSFSGEATSGSGATTLEDTRKDFLAFGVSIGDIVRNTTDNTYGIVSNVTTNTLSAIMYHSDGSSHDFSNEDNYVIYHDYVYSRRYEWNTRLKGTAQVNVQSGKRVRDVCHGYDNFSTPLCHTVSIPVAFSGNGGIPLITARDYEEDGVTEVGRAMFTPASSSSGNMRIANIDYGLAQGNGDLPDWFIRNKWYQYVYIAYSSGDIPGTTSVCTAGEDCLQLTINTTIENDIRALVMITGEEGLKEDGNTPQSWADAQLDDYVDLAENRNGDVSTSYIRMPSSSTFNDLIRIAFSCPADRSELCWSY